MTVTAFLIRDFFLSRPCRLVFAYATLGLLFVNVSIGGTLTHFAAPPVLMVASKWGWTTPTMLGLFGWRALIAVVLGTVGTCILFRKDLLASELTTDGIGQGATSKEPEPRASPLWILGFHFGFLALTVAFSHYLSVLIPLFLFFVGFCSVTREYQKELKLRESMLVAFFLGGLVTLGNLQDWWLAPLVGQFSPQSLFWGATALTAVTDNAALTYLGTLVPDLSDAAKYALVGGAVTGGGLTVIANAPNPAGYGILAPTFGDEGISPLYLFVGALPYTLLAALMFLV
jgi:Na+/H+ antiporter NhaD/arsenite permease-like protein